MLGDAEFLFFWIYLAIWGLLIRLVAYFRKRQRTWPMYATLVVFGLWGGLSIPLRIIEHDYAVFWTLLLIALVLITHKNSGSTPRAEQ